MAVVFGVLMMAVGAFLLFKPYVFYEMFRYLFIDKQRDPESFFIFSVKIVGAMLLLVGAFLIVVLFMF